MYLLDWCIELIYLAPLFNSNGNYSAVPQAAEQTRAGTNHDVHEHSAQVESGRARTEPL